uniref:PadR family transcriptional regulator n=1 Tax=Herbidospora sakaeratensis TaxID=564415 RepID=UPI000783F97C|nr:helix-turn-helix transcriptional regulator [Herbidospora sakaeratensis]
MLIMQYLAAARRQGMAAHGYAIARGTGLRSTTVYAVLERLEQRGLIVTETASTGRRHRRMCRLTPAGVTAAADLARRRTTT